MNNKKVYTKSTQTYKPLLLDDNTLVFAPQKEESPFGFWESTDKNRKTYLEVGLNFDRSFGEHGFTGLLLYNQSKLFDPSLAYVIPNAYQGLVGRITYNYKRRYMAEFNIGYNGTENFAPGKRFGYFPAYSLGWVLSEESFFPENDMISYVKFRGAYGEVGNDKIGGSRFLYLPSAYGFWDSYNLGIPGVSFQSYGAAFEGQIGNPDLTWERSKKSNIGVDLTLLKDKIRIIADYFYEHRDNILATPQTTPAIVGANLPPQNWGEMENSGLEAEINLTHKINNFNYWVNGTFTFARNKILFQDEVERPDAPYLHRTGQSKGQMFGYIAEGFYNTWEEVNDANRPVSSHQNNRIMPGDIRYKDINGDGVINSYDQVPIGYPSFPEIIYGISFGGDYKGFDFSVLFQGADNVSRRNSATTIRPHENNLFTLAYIPELSWTQEKYENGETIKLPHLNAQQQQVHDYQSSTFMVQDASYLRLKNAEIGYTFSSNLLKRFQISNCRVYVNGSNLLTWHGLFPGDDPEQLPLAGDSGYYPLTSTYNLGINLQF
jgi:TonB-linked SusC/RagA family outer membrane protein